jgi:2-polyprenyl-6-methoxyphenol hydroxylase-like FAD-dependent oxidoreductase
MDEAWRESGRDCDVLIAGAGPTGLTLAAQLARFGVRFRIIDKQLDRARESRALAVQARSLEVLQTLGLGEELARRGSTTTRLMLHIDRGDPPIIDLGNIGRDDTRFPFILFVSQRETEGVLTEHLASHDVAIERGTELVSFQQAPDGFLCALEHSGGRQESIRARYLAGCDGAHSTVRKCAGIPFEGDAYLQDFMLGDVEADGPFARDRLHSFAAGGSVAMFFPLGSPATWRVIAMRGATPFRARTAGGSTASIAQDNLELEELQQVVSEAAGPEIVLRDPIWLTHFRLHHRQARTYRAGRVFLAGDAAHIHSPVGAQGMNTGIQDAWNLGWKLALVTRGQAQVALLDTYQAERWPVGRTLLRYTDRLFSQFTRAMSAGRLAGWIRREVVARILPRAFKSRSLRSYAFRFVSELAIQYRRSAASTEGRPTLRSGPRAGDRLPDARVSRDSMPTFLHDELPLAAYWLLLCGPLSAWQGSGVQLLAERYRGVLVIDRLTKEDGVKVLLDVGDDALGRLGVDGTRHATAQYLVRPDGHIAFRCAGSELESLETYVASWLARSD